MLNKNDSKKEIEIDFVDVETFKSILIYIYSGYSRITDYNVMRLLKAAELFNLETLRDSCFDFFVKNLDKDTVCDAIIKVQNGEYDFDTRGLIKKCIKILDLHVHEIINSEVSLSYSIINFSRNG